MFTGIGLPSALCNYDVPKVWDRQTMGHCVRLEYWRIMYKERLCKKCNGAKSQSPSGTWYCRICHKQTCARYRVNNKMKIKSIAIAYCYGLSSSKYKAMLLKQEYSCAICSVKFTGKIKPYVDHDHACCNGQKTCGQCVRALLCNSCNTLIGKMERRPDWITKASTYLASY
jgi:hypothetical protein